MVVTITPNAGYTIGTQASATVSILDKPFDDWRCRQFAATGQQNAGASEPNGDPDADGRVNRLEFVLGTDPLAPTPAGNPTLRLAAGNAMFQYWHRGEARGVNATAKFAESLAPADWQPFPTGPVTISYNPLTGDRLLRYTLAITNLP